MIPTRAGLRPGPGHRTVRDDEDGAVLDVPAGWELLPPGDAAVTRAVKAAGPTWAVEEKRGRKSFSRGIWAPAEHIRQARAGTEEQRADPAYQRKLEAGRRRRAEEQADYVLEFQAEVLLFLRFHPRHAAVAAVLAERVTALATPVGSGTVARTERIPVERRAEAAVIAWMRHQTTAYDDMSVAPVKGARRELRRELAERSRGVLQRYRRGEEIDAACPLARALREAPPAAAAAPPPPRPVTPPLAPRALTPSVGSRVATLPAPCAAPLPPRPPAPRPPRAAAPLPPRPPAPLPPRAAAPLPPRAPAPIRPPARVATPLTGRAAAVVARLQVPAPLPPRAAAPLPPPARVATPLTGRAAAVVARLQAAAPPRPPESSPAPAPPRPSPPARAAAPPPRPPGAAARQTITRPSDAAPGEGAETEAPPSSAPPRTAHEEAQHALYLAVRDRLTKRR